MRPMRYPVVVHRWFATGAGWAYGPALVGRLLPVLKALDGPLKAGPDGGTFAIPAGDAGDAGDGRVLVGSAEPDAACDDPKARGRHPVILRAALLPRRPGPASRARVLAGLAALAPRAAGPDPALWLDVELDAEPDVEDVQVPPAPP